MRAFYVRPRRDGGYGAGDGTSYENAWNGVESATSIACGCSPPQATRAARSGRPTSRIICSRAGRARHRAASTP